MSSAVTHDRIFGLDQISLLSVLLRAALPSKCHGSFPFARPLDTVRDRCSEQHAAHGPLSGPPGVPGSKFRLLCIKVVVSLSPCFRGDFPESVTEDRYMTSE